MRIDVVAGVLLCALAVMTWYGSSHLPVGELRYFGSGFLPRVCAAALLVGGGALLFQGSIQAEAAAERLVLATRGPLMVGLGILVFALTIRGYSVGPATFPRFGMLLAGSLAIFFSGIGTVEARPRELIVLALGMSGFGALVFVELLDVPLPVLPGFLEGNLPEDWGVRWPSRIASLAFMGAAAVLASYFRLGARPATARTRETGQ